MEIQEGMLDAVDTDLALIDERFQAIERRLNEMEKRGMAYAEMCKHLAEGLAALTGAVGMLNDSVHGTGRSKT